MRKFYFSAFGHAIHFRIFFLFISAILSFSSYGQGPGTALSYNATPINPVNSLQNNEYLQLPTGVVQSLSQSFTIEAWVYWRGKYDNAVATSDQYQRIFDFGMNTDPLTGSWMYLTPYSTTGGTGVQFAISTTGLTSPQYIISGAPLTTNTWHHIAVTLDHATNTATLYIDGVSAASGSITLRPSMLGNTNQNYLGESQFNNDPSFNGIIDEFRISNVVRYASNFTPTATQFTTDANTVALYHFNEGSGQTTADASANAFNATLGLTTALEEDLDPDWITNSILPVKLENLTAVRAGAAVDLKWTASSTGEEGSFIIERSTNGSDFSEIGAVDINTTAGSMPYSFRDAAPAAGKNFYRLRIQEIQAATQYSGIVWVDMNQKDQYAVHPTAAHSSIFVMLPGADQVSIYNEIGILVQRLQLQASQQVSVQQLPKGLYHLQFEKGRKTVRFIKL